MYVQLDRIEDRNRAVLVPYPGNEGAFDLPAEMLPDGARPGDIFEMSLTLDAAKTSEARGEATALLEELLGTSGGRDSGRSNDIDRTDRRDDG